MDIGRISRCNYGFAYNGYFNPKIHTEDEKIWDNVSERLRAPKMDWIVKRVCLSLAFVPEGECLTILSVGNACATPPTYHNRVHRNVPLPRRHFWRHIQASYMGISI